MASFRVRLVVLLTAALVTSGPPAVAEAGVVGGHLAGACDMTVARFPGSIDAGCTGRATGAGYAQIGYGVYAWSASGAELGMSVIGNETCLSGLGYGYVSVHPVRIEGPDGRIDENGTLSTSFEWERFLGYLYIVHNQVVLSSSDGTYASGGALQGAMLWYPLNATYVDVAATCVGPSIAPLVVRLNGGEPGYAVL